ncbi:hypothetical protein J3R30DRAFT_19239 [Lentinula aciculospora]|uniref:Glutathione S-transferase n=1 Tax=Lentinula aciculospora TaxID=153920 RepID=A0A9W9AUV8_9AGAR|nr:hypothetical protein J3R30DRAFT_19239 [Lentinula aciculospora]
MFQRERRSWTTAEDELLRNAVAKEDPTRTFNPSKWHAISRHVPNRNNKDCRKRWFAKLAKADVAKGNWSPEEDEKLLKAIEKYGSRWTAIATAVETRNSDQCAKRWKDTLNPSIDRTSWTATEDAILIDAVQTHGNVWSKIVKTHFPGRTGLAAKNRYNSITRGNGSLGLPKLKHSPSPTSSETSVTPYSSSSSSTTSPVTPHLSLPDGSTPGLSPSTYFDIDLTEFSWPSMESQGYRSTVETLSLDDLFTLPPIKYPSSPSMSQVQTTSKDILLPDSTKQDLPLLSSTMSSFEGNSSTSSFLSSTSAQHPSNSSTKVLKLYGSIRSASTEQVQIVLHEKNIPYDFISLDAMPDTETRELIRQPYSGPVMEDDGFMLCESRAICRYLATKYADQGTKLIPDAYNMKLGALFEQAVFTEVFTFEPYASKAVYEKVTKRSKGLAADEAVFAGSIAALSSNLERYENVLSRQNYLAGDELTLADLYHIPQGAKLTDAGSDIMTRQGPNITRWWTEISARPSWATVRDGEHVHA